MRIPADRQPVHPGEVLLTEFLQPYGMTQKALAAHLGWTYTRVNEIVKGKRGITPDTALSLSEALGTTPEFWLNLQQAYDLWQAYQSHKSIEPLITV